MLKYIKMCALYRQMLFNNKDLNRVANTNNYEMKNIVFSFFITYSQVLISLVSVNNIQLNVAKHNGVIIIIIIIISCVTYNIAISIFNNLPLNLNTIFIIFICIHIYLRILIRSCPSALIRFPQARVKIFSLRFTLSVSCYLYNYNNICRKVRRLTALFGFLSQI